MSLAVDDALDVYLMTNGRSSREGDRFMVQVRGLLRSLDLGKSVAEFDEALEDYFVETDAFRQLIWDKIDIVAGDKGTGKQRYTEFYRRDTPASMV